MKASEIINDDILSREKRKSSDVVGKRTTTQDYFGNRADKKDDHELVSKDKSKERKKEWFEEDKDPCWKDYKQVGTKKKNGKTVPNCVPKESVEEGTDQFKAEHDAEVQRVANKHGKPLSAKHDYDRMGNAHNTRLHYPDKTVSVNTQKYGDNFGHNVFSKKGVEEGSMASAAHNSEGPKFGGYWKGSDKAPPKPGQGFGGAAESMGTELDEVAPPGMEDMVRKLKKEYKGHPEKAFATAWSIYNKKKGKK